MLEIRPTCEHCNKTLPNTSDKAMICSFECTFCKDCVDSLLHNVCPNCGGGFTKRPIRPSRLLQKYPVSLKTVHKPIDFNGFKEMLQVYKEIHPTKR